MPLIDKIKLKLAKLLGTHYAAVVSTLDRAVTAFGLVFATKVVGGDALDFRLLLHASWWQTTGTAALLAALSVVKSSIMLKITGTPALLSLTSATLRSRRNAGRKVQHKVPLRPGK